jgi:hypothetical protein
VVRGNEEYVHLKSLEDEFHYVESNMPTKEDKELDDREEYQRVQSPEKPAQPGDDDGHPAEGKETADEAEEPLAYPGAHSPMAAPTSQGPPSFTASGKFSFSGKGFSENYNLFEPHPAEAKDDGHGEGHEDYAVGSGEPLHEAEVSAAPYEPELIIAEPGTKDREPQDSPSAKPPFSQHSSYGSLHDID